MLTVPTKPTLGARLGRAVVRFYLRPRFRGSVPVEETRKTLVNLSRLSPLPQGARAKKDRPGGIPSEWVFARNASPGDRRVLLYFHGGGFYCGSPSTHRTFAAGLSAASGVPALLPDYRLAPEHPYPAANEDCLAVYQWLLDQGYDSRGIALGGDSAGGCLALMTLLSLREQGLPLPACTVLFSPLTDAVHFDGDSFSSKAAADPWFIPGDIPDHIARFTGKLEEKPEILCPLRHDLAGLPPLFIQTGADEILLSDSTRLAERAKAAGTNATLEVWDRMWHVFPSFATVVPEARKAVRNSGDFLRQHLGNGEKK